jgi:dipeptidyl aminopeptidase/acylaminoacyl peptidase
MKCCTKTCVRPEVYIYGWIMLLFFTHSFPACGQGNAKKKVTKEDFDKWGELRISGISDDTKWVTFSMLYENGTDTLFVKSTDASAEFIIPSGTNGKFIAAGTFACQLPSDKLKIIDLATRRSTILQNVGWFETASNGRYFVTSNRAYADAGTLYLRDTSGNIVDSLDDVATYRISPTKNAILYTSKAIGSKSIGIFHLDKPGHYTIDTAEEYEPEVLTWQEKGRYAAYIKKGNKGVIGVYDLNKGKLKIRAIEPVNGRMVIAPQYGLRIALDGTNVFFTMQDTVIAPANSHVPEIWKGDSKQYPLAPQMHGPEINLSQNVWYPVNDTVLTIGTANAAVIYLTGKHNFAITMNGNRYAPNYRLYPDTDYHIVSIKDNKQELLLEKQSTDPQLLQCSPVSDKLGYFRDGNWYVYDPVTRSHRNITGNYKGIWDTTGENLIPPVIPYGLAAWTEDDNYLLIHDKYDLWIFDLHKGSGARVTRGREQGRIYRLEPKQTATGGISIDNGLILTCDDLNSGARNYCYWVKNKSLQPLPSDGTWSDQLYRSPKGAFTFRQQAFQSPPEVVFKPSDTNEKSVVYSSNKHYKSYEWGSYEIIRYTDIKGNVLKGSLLYPAGYDPAKKYPMIVYMYESMSRKANFYTKPSLYAESGFNYMNYVLDGYFVLLPDIYYQIGYPGASVVDCLSSAVKAVTDRGLVNRDRVGLIGHSFGGYETNLAIGRTDLFAAAVSGAGISDSVGWYFSMGEDTGEPQAWRFENQQFRMGKSFYDDRQGYIDNAPIMRADSIHTPVLLWAGTMDTAVNMSQSLAMHLALRRLGKRNVFLAYPNQGHNIQDKAMQRDLSLRIAAWFGYFLKEEHLPEWMSEE